MEPLIIRISEDDNVAIAAEEIRKGTLLPDGIIAQCDIPQGHKIALFDLASGSPVTRYSTVLGHLNRDVRRGSWINEEMMDISPSPSLDNLEWGTNLVEGLPKPKRTTFLGYEVEGCEYAGTRNILGIMTSVQCVEGVLNVAVEKMRRELLPKYPNVDDIVPLVHPYGCGVAINAREAHIPIRSLRNLIRNPNFGGEVMLVSLGCEKLKVDMLLEKDEITHDNVVVLQEENGFGAMVSRLMEVAEPKLKRLNDRKRKELPLSRLMVGMQCGGSDAFSGITANPVAGYASDLLVSGGATVLFSEVTEVRDGAHILARRCVSKEVCSRLSSELKWYDDYLALGGVGRDANTTPGNKAGGLSNIVEKSMGSIVKSGKSPIVEVVGPGEKPTKKGLVFAATPASDIVCGPEQLSSGIALHVFMTGRGTPYGLAAAPVIKVCSRDEMKRKWDDLIDINTGVILKEGKTISEVGEELFNLIMDVASGVKKPYAEQYGLKNYFCVFNPAPIT